MLLIIIILKISEKTLLRLIFCFLLKEKLFFFEMVSILIYVVAKKEFL